MSAKVVLTDIELRGSGLFGTDGFHGKRICYNLLDPRSVHADSVQMNDGLEIPSGRIRRYDWRDDLSKSRDVTPREQEAYGYVLGWLEDWRQKRSLPAGREAATRWWREVAKAKDRPEWQLRQWQEAIRWFLGWLEICEKSGGDARGLGERLDDAVHHAGARRVRRQLELPPDDN